jgi:AraC family transcriptional regulator
VQRRLRTSDVLLSELRQPCSRTVPRHEHELSYFTLVLQGDYLEGDHGHLDELPPFTAVFNPAGATHSTVIGPAGAVMFTIELREEGLREFGITLPRRTIFDRGAGAMFWPGLRLYSAFKAATVAPPTAEENLPEAHVLEGHVLEMLVAIAGVDAPDRTVSPKAAPRWFERVKERLHEGFCEPLRMRDLAREAGVHPVHLARVFRRMERRTPGEYQQRLQVRAACVLLRNAEWPLSAIAAECGFADQSHFTRVFRKMAGTTPARFRHACSASRA